MAELAIADKLSHQEVKYERTSDRGGQYCDNCKHVIESVGGARCEAVKDPIYLNGWCIRWTGK
jgi:hypothetical protein